MSWLNTQRKDPHGVVHIVMVERADDECWLTWCYAEMTTAGTGSYTAYSIEGSVAANDEPLTCLACVALGLAP